MCFNLRTADLVNLIIFYIYERLCPRKKIRNRKKKEQQKLFINEIEHQTSRNLNAGWLTGEEWGWVGLKDPCKAWVPPTSNLIKLYAFG